ncbi:MAG TPA: glycogen debranching N-terminal domain-containing protein, partial [Solirubrobacteraceae bacterium]|nr:glycogen debranching N-terminal domain-containing protein [Solirubrobacteraceae bacterium]
SELHVSFAGEQPVLLARATESGSSAVVNQTNPVIVDLDGSTVPQETLNLKRTMLVAERLYCQLELRNFHAARVRVPLTMTLAADFADVFEIRGVRQRPARGETMVPNTGTTSVTFGYEGQDAIFRETLVELDPPPTAARVEDERVLLTWEAPLEARDTFRLMLTVTPGLDGRRPPRRAFARAIRRADRDLAAWRRGNTSVETDNELFQSVLTASVRDLYALLTPMPGGGRLLAAGIPWYVAPFGRDSLLTGYQCLMLSPQLARDTLLALAQVQARSDEPWRDAEPGKILHELRVGELAGAGLVPHTPYYGTVDATPLFVILAAAYYRWTADLETLATLHPALDAALEWIDRYGDQDGDGFVEYERRSPAGLANHGWKDSEDAIVHADGKLADGPIALVEAQGYVYLAKTSIAELYEAFGEPDRARELRSQARALRATFNDAFWNPDEGTLALALDGRKRQVASVTSNPGQCLYCGIVDDDKADPVAERLMAEDMFSGWGIRTLSSQSPAYNPMSYHNGSVWPHDNAIIAAGLKRYGHSGATMRIATSLFGIAARSRDYRLAELYCGFDRAGNTEIVNYPVACVPQAWAAATPFMLLQAMLGISAHAPSKTLAVVQPELPKWLQRAELQQLRIGAATVTLAFSQAHGITGFALVQQEGQIDVTMAATPISHDPPQGI